MLFKPLNQQIFLRTYNYYDSLFDFELLFGTLSCEEDGALLFVTLSRDADAAGPVEVTELVFAKEELLSSIKDEMSSVNFGVFEKRVLTFDCRHSTFRQRL